MSKPVQRPELVVAAEAIESDVRKLEELAVTARRGKLNTEKNIARAARELEEAMTQQERLSEGLKNLGEVMLRMQQRQQGALEGLSARALEIQQRMALLTEHMQRFGALGAQAAEAAQLLQAIPAPQDGGDPGGKNHAAASALIEVDERFTTLVEQARDLASAAQAEDFVEIAREADALKQKIHAMRGRLAELVRSQSAGTS